LVQLSQPIFIAIETAVNPKKFKGDRDHSPDNHYNLRDYGIVCPLAKNSQ
jgi:hypothetical protein